jgi:trk system potassium uptake protein TrkA
MLKDCKLPSSLILSLIFRGGEVIIPSGDTCLQADDKAVAIVTREGVREIEPLFPG